MSNLYRTSLVMENAENVEKVKHNLVLDTYPFEHVCVEVQSAPGELLVYAASCVSRCQSIQMKETYYRRKPHD